MVCTPLRQAPAHCLCWVSCIVQVEVNHGVMWLRNGSALSVTDRSPGGINVKHSRDHRTLLLIRPLCVSPFSDSVLNHCFVSAHDVQSIVESFGSHGSRLWRVRFSVIASGLCSNFQALLRNPKPLMGCELTLRDDAG